MNAPNSAAQPIERPAGPPTGGSLGLRRIKKGRRLKGEEGRQFATDVVKAYEIASIRRICKETGRSYGAIYRLLSASGVTMRSRGPTAASSADAS